MGPTSEEEYLSMRSRRRGATVAAPAPRDSRPSRPQRPRDSSPAEARSAAGNELGHVELLHVQPAAPLAGRAQRHALSPAPARGPRALDARFSVRLLQARDALAPADIAIAGRHDRHPHLV